MSHRPLVVLALALGSFASASTGVADWPQWGGPGRNFQRPAAALAESWGEEGPTELWRRPLGDGYSAIVAAEDTLFTMVRDGDQDVVVAIDAGSGATLWRHGWDAPPAEFLSLGFGPGPHSTPLVVDDRVFAVGGLGRLVALDRTTGRRLWARELWRELDGTRLERGYAASPLAWGDLVVLPVGGEGRGVVAFRQTDGSEAWRALDHPAAYASPILAELDGREQIVALLDTAVAGLDPACGEPLWELPVSRERYVHVASPVFTSGDLFLVSVEGARLIEVASEGGRIRPDERWRAKTIGSQVGNVTRQGNHLYGSRGSSASYLTAVDVETGEMAWRDREVGDATLVGVGDLTLLLEDDGVLRLVRLSPRGLSTLARAQILSGRSWTPPTLVGTRLYARDRKEIVALELGRVER